MQKEINWLLKDKYHGKPTKQFHKDVMRLEKGEPMDYVIGFTDFLGCKIDLSRRPLIPRPETEFWLDTAIKQLSQNSDGRPNLEVKVLDIFAGSGCIGVAVMRHVENVTVVFAEKDKNLISQIKLNCRNNGIAAKRYKAVQSDVFSNVTGKFDYIFANPPYISTKRKNKIQLSVLRYEPKAALFGGADGLFYIKKLLAQAPLFLHSGGKIFMEFDPVQKKSIEVLLKKSDYKTWQFNKDQYQRWRWVEVSYCKG